MKKVLTIVMAVLVLVSTVAPAFALLRRDYSAVEGPVVAKDQNAKTITVLIGGGEKVFNADDGQFSRANVGDTVLILHQNQTSSIGTIVVTQPKP